MLFRFSRPVFWAVVLSLVAVWGLPAAQADWIYTLDSNGGTRNAPSTPEPTTGTVDVHLTDSTHATITFQSASGWVFGDSSVIDFNVNGTATVTPSPSDPSFTTGTGNVDGVGTFSNEYSITGGFSNPFTTAAFTLVATGGTTWGDASSVLTLNDKLFDAAAHVAPTSNLTNTYYSGNSGGGGPDQTNSVPEPTSLAIWGVFGLAGLAYKRRKMRRA